MFSGGRERVHWERMGSFVLLQSHKYILLSYLFCIAEDLGSIWSFQVFAIAFPYLKGHNLTNLFAN